MAQKASRQFLPNANRVSESFICGLAVRCYRQAAGHCSCPQPAAFDRAGRKGAGPVQPAPIAPDQLLIISRVELWFTPTVADAPETGTPKIDPCTVAVLLSDFWCVRVVTGPSVLTLSRARIWVRCRPFSWNTR